MKKLLLLALTAVMMAGCDEPQTTGIETLEIDSCEYFYGDYRLTHKGNCRFCEERDSIKWEKRKKEFEELIIKLKEE